MSVIREQDVPIAFEDATNTVRQTKAGDMTIEFDQLEPNLNMDALFQGLPDDRCQAEHWGFVLEGEMRYQLASGEEIVAREGEAYYIPPGHLPHTGATGCKVFELS
jgi:hypothetical protein